MIWEQARKGLDTTYYHWILTTHTRLCGKPKQVYKNIEFLSNCIEKELIINQERRIGRVSSVSTVNWWRDESYEKGLCCSWGLLEWWILQESPWPNHSWCPTKSESQMHYECSGGAFYQSYHELNIPSYHLCE